MRMFPSFAGQGRFHAYAKVKDVFCFQGTDSLKYVKYGLISKNKQNLPLGKREKMFWARQGVLSAHVLHPVGIFQKLDFKKFYIYETFFH